MALDYYQLKRSEFDTIVTGELTQISLSLEIEISKFITYYYLHRSPKKFEFIQNVMFGGGFNFQNKVDIANGIITHFENGNIKAEAKRLLLKLNEIKSLRNTLAHGFKTTENEKKELEINLVTFKKDGARKVIKITPENHLKLMNDYQQLITDFKKWRITSLKYIYRRKK